MQQEGLEAPQHLPVFWRELLPFVRLVCGDPSLAYCAKYDRIMDGWTVTRYCRGNGGCDQ